MVYCNPINWFNLFFLFVFPSYISSELVWSALLRAAFRGTNKPRSRPRACGFRNKWFSPPREGLRRRANRGLVKSHLAATKKKHLAVAP